MDPFDEFEFKPLTEGLGFHKKTVSLKEGLKKSGVIDDELSDLPGSLPRNLLDNSKIPMAPKHTFEDVLSALEKTPLKKQSALNLDFTDALPRQKETIKAMDVELPRAPKKPTAPVQSPFPQPDAYKAPLASKIQQVPVASTGTRRGAADSPQRRLLEPASFSFASAFLDFIIVLAMSIVFLIALLVVTKVNLSLVLANLNKDLMTQISFGVLFVAVMQMYAVVSRSFFGRTIGEWTFDMQLGEDKEQQLESYPLRVAFRSLLNTLTGLVLLPLVSAVIGRDIAGRLSGVQLYRQRE